MEARKRREHYSGKYPKKFSEKYKELNPEKYSYIAEHVISELMQTVARENECRYDEKTGMAIRIVDGKVIEANTESFKKIDQRRKEAGREVKTIKTNTKTERDR